MFREMTIGQYYPVNSVLHRLDPRVKLLATLIFLVTTFIYPGVLGFVIVFASLVTIIKLSKVPFSYIVRGLRGVIVIICITAVFNMFFTDGQIIFQLWKLKLTYEGIYNAIKMVFRIGILIIGTSLMTLTTTPNQLTDGLERAFRPLNKIHFPVHELAMMMSIALRFIPILVEETDKIMKAQMARGAEFDEGGLFKKIKALIPLLVPLFVSAFRRANDLALAMEARCYHGGEGRTKMKPLCYTSIDKAAYVIIFLYLAVIIALKILSANGVIVLWDGLEIYRFLKAFIGIMMREGRMMI